MLRPGVPKTGVGSYLQLHRQGGKGGDNTFECDVFREKHSRPHIYSRGREEKQEDW